MAAPAPQGPPPPRGPLPIDLTKDRKLQQGKLMFKPITKAQYFESTAKQAQEMAEKAAQAKASAPPAPEKRGPGRPKGSTKKVTVQLVPEGATDANLRVAAADSPAATEAGAATGGAASTRTQVSGK